MVLDIWWTFTKKHVGVVPITQDESIQFLKMNVLTLFL
jgi:hypothetical protein